MSKTTQQAAADLHAAFAELVDALLAEAVRALQLVTRVIRWIERRAA